MKTVSVVVIAVACGSQPAPVKNTAPPERTVVHEEKPTCLSAIESWYFHAGIQPASAPTDTDAQFEASIAAMRANQHVLVEGCQQDQWSRDTRRCFTTLDSMALGVTPHEPDQCKRMLDATQLENLQVRIRRLGESLLD